MLQMQSSNDFFCMQEGWESEYFKYTLQSDFTP